MNTTNWSSIAPVILSANVPAMSMFRKGERDWALKSLVFYIIALSSEWVVKA